VQVLHAPTPTGGNAWGLAQAERMLGLDSKVVYYTKSPFDYPSHQCLHLERFSDPFNLFFRQLLFFLRSRNKFDIFHFNFGRSLFYAPYTFLNHLDLRFYPKKARLFVTYNGCDARQKDYCVNNYEISACHEPLCYGGACTPQKDHIKRHSIAKMNQYVSGVFVVNPDLCNVVPRAVFLPYTIANFFDIPKRPPATGKVLNIVHAPTDRYTKGSKYVIEAFKVIEKRYKNIRPILVEKLLREEALKIYLEADIIVDQLLVGWYGAFAVEAMKMGKPVVCYIREEDLKYVPAGMVQDIPIIRANKNNILDVLCELLENPSDLERISNQSLEYVWKWHHPSYVASITKSAYEKSLYS